MMNTLPWKYWDRQVNYIYRTWLSTIVLNGSEKNREDVWRKDKTAVKTAFHHGINSKNIQEVFDNVKGIRNTTNKRRRYMAYTTIYFVTGGNSNAISKLE